MKEKPPRPYRMNARSEAAARTGRAILSAAVALWREHAFEDLTLQAIADRAGVSVQTVIRRYGSKEGVIEACIEGDAAGIVAERDQAAAGDLGGALAVLLDHYERDGDAVLRTLDLEGRVEAARAMVRAGRASHRAWCARVFAPYLPSPEAEGYPSALDAFVVATDVYLWKLLRRDLGRSPSEAEAAMRRLIEGLSSQSTPPT
jgi:AcrR family transcriptional regulator